MRLNKLDLNLLVVLDALLREKHITHAALRLHLSQSATSGALGRLRDYFDDPLLVRAGSRMDLTPLASSLQEPVQRILQDIRSTVEIRPDFDPASSTRTFCFMMSDYVAMVFGPELVRLVAKQAPNVRLKFRNPKSFPEEDLARGAIDFLILPLDWSGSFKGCDSEVLIEDGLVCIGWEGNTLLSKPMDMETFAQAGHVLISLDDDREPLVQRLFREQLGIELNREIVTANFGTIPLYLEGTQRLCLMHTHLAKEWMKIFPIRSMPLPADLPLFHWNIFWHKSREYDPSLKWLLDCCRQLGKEKFQLNYKAPGSPDV